MKAWIGIDPGKTGAMAIMFEDGVCAYVDWVNEVHMYNTLIMWTDVYQVVNVALEDTPAMAMDSKQSTTTFQQHCGAWKCLIKIAGYKPLMVRPQRWMKRRIGRKLNSRDKPSVRYVVAKYPYVDIHGPRGGLKDGRTDAICIAEWCKEQSTTK